MNNKAILPALILPAVIGIIALTLLVAFLFSGTLRFFLIGIGLFVAAVYIIGTVDDARLKTIFAVVLIGGGLFFIFGSGLFVQEFIGGSTTLSLDNVNFDGKDLIIVTVALGTGYDTYIIDWDGSLLEDELDAVTVRDGVNGVITISNFSSEFNLHKSTIPNDIWWRTTVAFNDGVNVPGGIGRCFGGGLSPPSGSEKLACGISWCESLGESDTVNWYAQPHGLGFSWDLACIRIIEYAARGDLTGDVSKKFIITVEIEGETKTMNQDDNFITLHNGDVRVELTGGELAAFNTIAEVPFDILWQPSEFQYLISESAVSLIGRSEAVDFLQNFAGNEEHDIGSGGDPFDNIFFNRQDDWTIGLFDTLVNQNDIFTQSPIIQSVNIGTTKGGSYGSVANGDLVVNTVPTGFPVIRLIIDAEFVGIVATKGEPEITQCVSDTSLDSGENVEKTFRVKNIGDETGDFNAKADCGTNSNIDVDIADIGLVNEGQTKTVEILIGGEAPTEDLSGTCTLTVSDFGSGDEDSCSFGVNIQFVETLCEPNRVSCQGNNLTQCASDGNSEEVLEDCTEGCGFNFETGDSECKVVGGGFAPPSTTPPTTPPSNKTQAQLDCEQKAIDNPLLGYTFVKRTLEPSFTSKAITILTFGVIGDLSPEIEESCEARFVPYYIIGGAVILLGFIIFLVMRSPRKKNGGK